jgi:ATP-dependent RNA circularization protein (DNA/RNA ligase family)
MAAQVHRGLQQPSIMTDLSSVFEEALSRNEARWESYTDLRYLRFSDDFRGNPKGTVSWQRRLVPGYPHIGRIFRLEQGLAQQFGGPFRVEEQENGYWLLAIGYWLLGLGARQGGPQADRHASSALRRRRDCRLRR